MTNPEQLKKLHEMLLAIPDARELMHALVDRMFDKPSGKLVVTLTVLAGALMTEGLTEEEAEEMMREGDAFLEVLFERLMGKLPGPILRTDDFD